jgi:solute:Na+ symporter, SSS family
MFPHLFQHWLTAKSAETFRLTVVAHPVCIMIVWVPCILIGIWATGATLPDGSLVVPVNHPKNTELAIMVKRLTSPIVSGILAAGILAAIMSSLDSQFFCIGTMFTNDIIVHHFGEDRFNDRQKVWMARGFICLIVLVTYFFSLTAPRRVFTLGIWCFSGFASLFPLIFTALYWRRVTKAGAISSVVVTAVVWFILFKRSGYGSNPNYLVLGMMPVTFIFLASLFTIVLVSMVTDPPRDEIIEKFFVRLHPR